jgi:hypothetical protein
MPEKFRRSSSVYDIHSRRKTKDLLDNKIRLSDKQLNFGIIIGVILTIVTIALQCVAVFTPHWKEISPNTNSLYVDGVDALIRTEVLIYFNSVHRFNRHSYGLFQRCEYALSNSSNAMNKPESIFNIALYKHQKTCTKNFLPSYDDAQFDECHSLAYYRFCSKTSEKNFNIDNDYLRATFDISPNLHMNGNSKSSCHCHYPAYVKACHILGILAFIFLILTASLFSSFLCRPTRHQRLKLKCFGVLSSLLSTLFLLINLLVVLNHLQYESIEYLVAIERHYRSSQIYKLSQDTKIVIDRFISSVNIEIGYSTIIAWIAFFLSIIDGVLLMLTCKVTVDEYEITASFTGLPEDSPRLSYSTENVEHQPSMTSRTSTPNSTIAQLLPPPLPPSVPLPPTVAITDSEEQSNSRSYSPPSCLKRPSSSRIHFEDTV